MWEGVSPSHDVDFLDFRGTKTRFQCIIKFKLTSSLAPNAYDCSTRGEGGGGRFCLNEWRGCGRGPPPTVGT